MTSRAPSIGAFVLRVRDPLRKTVFWSAALHDVERVPAGDDRVSLRPHDGVGVDLTLHPHASEYGMPDRFHLDLFADDRASEVTPVGVREAHWITGARPTGC